MSTYTSGGGEDRLYVVLVALTGRRLTMSEVYQAVGLSRQQYSEARANGTLITPNRMVLAAAHLDINPVELLTECGILTARDAAEYVDERRREVADLFDNPTTRGAAKGVSKRGQTTTDQRRRTEADLGKPSV